MTRNSRMPGSLAGDLDAECSACPMGARRLGDLFARYGRADVEACFDAIIDRTTETFRRELLAELPDGTFVWEDYAEHDGVDPPRLHAQAHHAHRRQGGVYGEDATHVAPDSRNIPAEFTAATPAVHHRAGRLPEAVLGDGGLEPPHAQPRRTHLWSGAGQPRGLVARRVYIRGMRGRPLGRR